MRPDSWKRARRDRLAATRNLLHYPSGFSAASATGSSLRRQGHIDAEEVMQASNSGWSYRPSRCRWSLPDCLVQAHRSAQPLVIGSLRPPWNDYRQFPGSVTTHRGPRLA